MNAKKIFVGGIILSTMFINFSTALAEPEVVEIFGGDFEDIEKNSAAEVSEPFQAQKNSSEPEQKISDAEKKSDAEQISEAEQKISDADKKISEVEQKISDAEQKISEVTKKITDAQKITDAGKFSAQKDSAAETSEVDDDENLGDELNFDDLTNRDQNKNSDSEVIEKISDPVETEIIEIDEIKPSASREKILQPSTSDKKNSKQKKLSTLKQRFVKLTMDTNYIYYLDRDFVRWQKMPYSTTEMMADVWVRMIERNDNELLTPYEVDDIVFAAEQGQQYRPEDVEVLCHGKYHLEHYYLRPKARQIQYLVELSDIEGNPQNTVNERPYSYSNWENLVPNSVESRLYFSILKVIGKGRASADAPVTIADMVEEYARISIR